MTSRNGSCNDARGSHNTPLVHDHRCDNIDYECTTISDNHVGHSCSHPYLGWWLAHARVVDDDGGDDQSGHVLTEALVPVVSADTGRLARADTEAMPFRLTRNVQRFIGPFQLNGTYAACMAAISGCLVQVCVCPVVCLCVGVPQSCLTCT
jgi:hypothetical protein